MYKIWKLIFILFFLLLPFSPLVLVQVKAQNSSSCPSDDPCKDKGSAFDKVNCYSSIVNTCSNQRQSMASQIVYLNTKIGLTTAKIDGSKEKILALEEEIVELGEKIEKLEHSLTNITSVFIDRIIATYKYGEMSYFDLLLTSRRFADFINRYKYIQTVQAHDRKILFQLQNSKEKILALEEEIVVLGEKIEKL